MKKTKLSPTVLVFLALSMCGFSSQALAATITIYYEGVIDFIKPGGAFDGIGVSFGDTFNGTYTYQTVVDDSDPAAEFGQYNYNSLAPSGMTFTLNIGTLSTSTDPANPESSIRVLAFDTFDEYRVNTRLPELPGSDGGLFVDIPTNWGGGTITSDALPLFAPDMATATFNEILINDLQGGQLAGRITLLELQPIPVPAAGWLFVSGTLALLGLSRRRRSEAAAS